MSSCRKCCTAWFLFSHFTPVGYHGRRLVRRSRLPLTLYFPVRFARVAIGDNFDPAIDRPFLAGLRLLQPTIDRVSACHQQIVDQLSAQSSEILVKLFEKHIDLFLSVFASWI